MSSNSNVSQSQRPVGPLMKAREGLEFLVRVGALEVETLSKSKHPSNVADLNHLEGLCYELCRFIQAARSAYERLLNSARRDPEYLENCIVGLRDLLEAVADGEEFKLELEKGTYIRIFGDRFQRKETRTALPFVFWSKTIHQALLVTAVYYLALGADAHLIRRCRNGDCRKLFMAVRRSRVYCSHECASHVSYLAYEQRQKAGKPQ